MSNNRIEEILKNPLTVLIANACITYGVITTQLQWVRSDIEIMRGDVKRLENSIFFDKKAKNEKVSVANYSCTSHDARLLEKSSRTMRRELFIG